MSAIEWPPEEAKPRSQSAPQFQQPLSNICLDFHGDPHRAGLCIFSDGNHHMALEETLQRFLHDHPAVTDVFYTTTPPRVALDLLAAGMLHLGNLKLSVKPHVFIGPKPVLDQVVATGRASNHRAFSRSRGNVLLVRKGNPKGISGIADLERDDVRLFMSNPKTEAASFEVYAESLKSFAQRRTIALDFLGEPHPQIVYGSGIHHREAPQTLAEARADVAFVYYHLALRYTRIFPDLFEIVWPDQPGTPESPCNVTTNYHCGLVDDGGAWGQALLDFLFTPAVAEIYAKHGLAQA